MSGVFRQSDQSRQFVSSSILGRMARTARAGLPTLREGGQFLGIIPKSVRISKCGWVSDIISYTDGTPRMTQKHIDLVSLCFYFYRPRKYDRGYIFSLFVSSHPRGGGGVPHIHPIVPPTRTGQGTPQPHQDGIPPARMGYTQLGQDGVHPLSQYRRGSPPAG